jgi:uncharacterized protein YjbI with pentapeptide repeats
MPKASSQLDEKLRKSLGFAELYEISDPICREYELVQKANSHGLPPESYRQMFNDYCHEQAKAKVTWWNSFPSWLEVQFEEIARSLAEADFFKILEYLAKLSALSIVIGVIGFFIGIHRQAEQSRKELAVQQQQQVTQQQQKEIERKRSHYDAWRIITENKGEIASGGRIDAIQDLNNDGVSLAGIDVHGAFLPGVVVANGDLFRANLNGSILVKADFSNAILVQAQLNRAILTDANLAKANLRNANLVEADLRNADLKDAVLTGANLAGADLRSVRNLTVAQVQTAQNWQQAQYDEAFRKQL